VYEASFVVWVQALQYLRKLCSHPLLVLDKDVPQHVAAAMAETKAPPEAWNMPSSPLRQLHHAPKLLALQELLQVRGPLLPIYHP
jgi:TATA-binding protein-associated factor